MLLRDEFRRYRVACYGDGPLPPDQERQIEHAFLAGVLVIATEPCMLADRKDRDWIMKQAEVRLMEIGAFPIEGN